MSCNLSKVLKLKTLNLDVLKGKTLAIDIMPTLYKYLYTYSIKDQTVLRSSKGEITSHLMGLLSFLKNLKIQEITPVICLDLNPPQLKREEVARRKDTRVKALEKLKLLEDNGLELNLQQTKSKINHTLYIGLKEKELVLEMLELLGISTYTMDYMEAQKCCVNLKKKGLVDQIYSEDRDLILYGCSFYSKVNFQKNTIEYLNYGNYLEEVGLTPQELQLVALAVGTDYSKGVPFMGPHKAFKQIRKKQSFVQKLRSNVPNYKEIVEYLDQPLPVGPQYLKKGKPDPVNFIKRMEQLNFSSKFTLSISSFLFE